VQRAMALPAMATHLRGRATSTASMANCALKTLTYRRGWATPTASMANCAIKAPRDYPWAAVQGAMAVPAMTTHLRGRPRPETTTCATTLRGNALFLRANPMENLAQIEIGVPDQPTSKAPREHPWAAVQRALVLPTTATHLRSWTVEKLQSFRIREHGGRRASLRPRLGHAVTPAEDTGPTAM
jgi:hypothetical protein